MNEELRAEYIVQHKQLLLKHPASLGAFVRYYIFAPHPEELPSLELFEETELFDMII